MTTTPQPDKPDKGERRRITITFANENAACFCLHTIGKMIAIGTPPEVRVTLRIQDILCRAKRVQKHTTIYGNSQKPKRLAKTQAQYHHATSENQIIKKARRHADQVGSNGWRLDYDGPRLEGWKNNPHGFSS